ncbi:MAG: cytochrome c oxidase assembly protein [Alphaproteobacteria bacterium]|jgi:cytochrome c oxidase assembly protein subunit 11|nr:cytochrome c oxidase assembly protein [Alphaproteobacteria bacterium]
MIEQASRDQRRRRNRYVFAGLVAMVVVMNGFAYATVPAYRAFCQKFGFAGTPLVEASGPESEEILTDRPITIRFNSDIEPSLDWRFKPVQRSIDMHVGETGLAFFEAENNQSESVTGTATFNVTPLKAAPYFVKIECFCFTEQTLGAGEHAQMPVTFFVDPAIVEDRNLDDVTAITLSYTFFRDHDADAERKAAAVATQTNIQVN